MTVDTSHHPMPDHGVGSTDLRQLSLVYGAAHFGKSLFWNASVLMFAYFLTEIALLPTKTMGTILAISLAANAVMDMTTGYALGRYVQTVQSAGRVQFYGSLAAAVAFVSFSATAVVDQENRAFFALLSILAFRVGYSLYDVPQNSYMAFAAQTDAIRARLGATRYIASGIALLVLTLIFGPAIRNATAENQGFLFAAFSMILAVAAILTSLLLYLYSRKLNDDNLHRKTDITNQSIPTSHNPVLRLFSGAGGGLYCALLLSIFSFSFFGTGFSKMEAYYTAYGPISSFTAGLFMTAVAIGKILSQPVWEYSAVRLGLERTLITAAVLMIVASLLFGSVGQVSGLLTLLTAFLYGFTWGGVAMAIWSLLSRAASRDVTLTTFRYGAFTFFSKLGQSIGIYMLGVILGLFDYKASGSDLISILMAASPILSACLILVSIFVYLLNAKAGPSQN